MPEWNSDGRVPSIFLALALETDLKVIRFEYILNTAYYSPADPR